MRRTLLAASGMAIYIGASQLSWGERALPIDYAIVFSLVGGLVGSIASIFSVFSAANAPGFPRVWNL
jgi:hypothetical protein